MPVTSVTTLLADYLADYFAREAAELGAHWQTRARAAVPRPPDQPPIADAALAERIVAAVGAALRDDGRWQDDIMRAGWELGTAAQAVQYAQDALLTELELLTAILLYAAERHTDALDTPRAVATTPPTETFAAIRRMHEAASLLTLAATRGHAHHQEETLRSHLRSLRHDLRNPIGTIQSAAALMQDETLPAEQRANPRYAQMVVRNAQSLQELITRGLGDEGTAPPSHLTQRVSLRDLAATVRRAVRAEAERAECRVEIDDGLPEVRAAVGGLELTLRSLLAATIAALPQGSTVHIAAAPTQPGRTRVAVLTQPPLRDAARVAAAAGAIAESTGSEVGAEDGWVWAEIAVAEEEGGK
ncbi:MAG TPA: histidine kinase dimerization/phospho-acceptor domain-containing protein [Gemmatimonadaceae bacterium]|nr:histidine kinase dimerization/phospho-acceptor domain-containing protein [Gemmatimonadaceae bacterium]